MIDLEHFAERVQAAYNQLTAQQRQSAAARPRSREDELKASRRQGLEAYSRAMAGRQFRPGVIRASFMDVLRYGDDDI